MIKYCDGLVFRLGFDAVSRGRGVWEGFVLSWFRLLPLMVVLGKNVVVNLFPCYRTSSLLNL